MTVYQGYEACDADIDTRDETQEAIVYTGLFRSSVTLQAVGNVGLRKTLLEGACIAGAEVEPMGLE